MKKYSAILLIFSFIVILISCTSYQDKEYGPVGFNTEFEVDDDDYFEGMLLEAIASETILFKPEDYGFSKESVGGMRLKSITLNTENEAGFGVFDNLKVEVSSAKTDMLTIGVLNTVPKSKSVTIEGLEDAKIKKFKEVDDFVLHVSGNLNQTFENTFDVHGTFTLSVESSEE